MAEMYICIENIKIFDPIKSFEWLWTS